MDSNNKKILTVSFALAGALVGLVIGIFIGLLSAAAGKLEPYLQLDLVKHGLPLTLGFLTFALLQFNSKVLTWGEEVIVEIRKVVWPSRKDTAAMTTVVCVMVVISGIILGVFDLCSSFLVNFLVTFRF